MQFELEARQTNPIRIWCTHLIICVPDSFFVENIFEALLLQRYFRSLFERLFLFFKPEPDCSRLFKVFSTNDVTASLALYFAASLIFLPLRVSLAILATVFRLFELRFYNWQYPSVK